MSEQPVRVLSLDGGGVRGLSTLLILQAIFLEMCEIIGIEYENLRPKDVFDVIVGTSTGGLIALMMVKLDLSIDQCIEQYKVLSRKIFGKPNFIGKHSGGLLKPRYSGRVVRRFVVDLVKNCRGGSGEDLYMEDTSGDDNVRCSVVCREREDNWTKTRKSEPVFLCTHRCRGQPGTSYKRCTVPEAACATSAAPTYFEYVKILGKILVDGGYGETNNPSSAALEHYRIENRNWNIPFNKHLLWLNIGTGSPQPDMSATRSKRPWFIPNFILEPYNLMNDMQKMATDSEQVVKYMNRFAKESHGFLQYFRLSADNGLHMIGLDDYEKVDDDTIKGLTSDYLTRRDIQDKVRAIAELFADAYKERRVALRHASTVSSPVRGGPNNAIISPVVLVPPVPALSHGCVTDETPDLPRTPEPLHAQPVPPAEVSSKSQSNDTIGFGHQFSQQESLHRPQLTLNITATNNNNDDVLRGDMFL